jgi:mannosyltransferase OCH1-like enzyme
MNGRKVAFVLLTLLGLILAGTVVVLSFVQVYFGVDERDQITVTEAEYWERTPTLPLGSNDTSLRIERIPRIVHQTWKTAQIPEKWIPARESCKAMNPDLCGRVSFISLLTRRTIASTFSGPTNPPATLWLPTTPGSSTFTTTTLTRFKERMPWCVSGAICSLQKLTLAQRYFVLHHYGGVYQDLDIGCQRPMRPLLNFDIVLPRTIPVGISNDLMFAAPHHPFMELVIHNLVTFNHQYGTHYPTVMFSTGPMFLSAQYGLWPSVDGVRGGVRVLPKSLYGKNARPDEMEHSFFLHYYGSSWHEGDAGFIKLVRSACESARL